MMFVCFPPSFSHLSCPFTRLQKERLDDLRETAMGVLDELEHEGPKVERKEEPSEEEIKVKILGFPNHNFHPET